MKTSIHDFDEQTCALFNPIKMFIAIHRAANGDPCTTGCAYFEGGKCLGYKKLHTPIEKQPKIAPTDSIPSSNADIAAKLNCSPRQVSKMRKNGTLPDQYK